MTDEEIENAVKDCIATHFGISPKSFSRSANIFHDLNGDCLDEVEIIMTIEDNFNIEIPDNNYETVNDFIREVTNAKKV